MSFERKVRVARLPEMRLAYFETSLPAEAVPEAALAPAFSELWDRFNEWRVQVRPALGRIDIAAMGLHIVSEDGQVYYRAAVPVRSDYEPPGPARTTFFPGGAFAYCYADDADEQAEAFRAVASFVEEQGWELASGPIEVYQFHFNLEQHPADCGVLVRGATVPQAGPTHDRPLPIG
jgi:effector-binding domain-containing protein